RERVRSAQRRSRRGGRARLAIYGAGHRGAALAALLQHGFPRAEVVGFLDDRVSAKSVSGHPVLGAERDLDTLHVVHQINQIWMTFEPEKHKNDRLRNWAQRHDVKIVVLPTLEPFLSLQERRSPAPAPGFRNKLAQSPQPLEPDSG
ncbi:MAG: hypothetical protein R6V07_19055, partial [Armatimonadota bacterium]